MTGVLSVSCLNTVKYAFLYFLRIPVVMYLLEAKAPFSILSLAFFIVNVRVTVPVKSFNPSKVMVAVPANVLFS